MVYKKKEVEETKAEAKEEAKEEEKNTVTETWAKARFSYIEMKDHPGAVWKISPQGVREEFKDGEIYERPLAFFEMLNNECREVKRKHVKGSEGNVGQYVKTSQYTKRIIFDVISTYDKEVPKKVKRLKVG